MMECLTVSNLLKYYIIILDVIFGPGPTTMYDYLGGNRTTSRLPFLLVRIISRGNTDPLQGIIISGLYPHSIYKGCVKTSFQHYHYIHHFNIIIITVYTTVFQSNIISPLQHT